MGSVKACGIPEPQGWSHGRNAKPRVCQLPPHADGPCDWERCGEGGLTGDPYCDAACQLPTGHDGPHAGAVSWT